MAVAPAARAGAVDRHDLDVAGRKHGGKDILAALAQIPLPQDLAKAGASFQKAFLLLVGHDLCGAADEQVVVIDDDGYVGEEMGEDAGGLDGMRLPLVLLPGAGAEEGALEEEAGVVHGQQLIAEAVDARYGSLDTGHKINLPILPSSAARRRQNQEGIAALQH